jgi:hypothetical protein
VGRNSTLCAKAAVIGIDGARQGVRVDLEVRAERCGDLMCRRMENGGREGYRASAMGLGLVEGARVRAA